MSQKTVTLYNQTPKITDQDNIYHLSSICPVYQAPENVSVTSAEEMIKVVKKYQEVCIYTKKRRFTGYDHTFYRCLFSNLTSATKAHEDISKKWDKNCYLFCLCIL